MGLCGYTTHAKSTNEGAKSSLAPENAPRIDVKDGDDDDDEEEGDEGDDHNLVVDVVAVFIAFFLGEPVGVGHGGWRGSHGNYRR